MNSDLDMYNNKDLLAPIVFSSEFNNFERINANQAWSLFFTAGKEDQKLGSNPEAGRFLTYMLVGIGIAGSLWGVVFTGLT